MERLGARATPSVMFFERRLEDMDCGLRDVSQWSAAQAVMLRGGECEG
jgi:hypothetical protein